MPGLSLSLPAGPGFCPFMNASTPEHVCSSCYARQGRMAMNKKKYMENRNALITALRTNDWHGLGEELVRAGSRHLRIFSSGDFLSTTPEDLNLEINRLWYPALRLLEGADIRVWISSRVPNVYPGLFRAITALPWVNVRACSPVIDQYLPQPVTTTAIVLDKVDPPGDTFFCRKTYDGSCEQSECLACWDKRVQVIGYQLHGHRVRG